MTINREFAKKQIGRLSGCSFFPTMEDGIRELVDTLMKHTKSEERARRVIDLALETSGKCPTPFDLVQLCRSIGEGSKLPDGCQECGGGNWRFTESGATRCVCARGKALAAMDADRKSEYFDPRAITGDRPEVEA
jgi:hypothetical protein